MTRACPETAGGYRVDDVVAEITSNGRPATRQRRTTDRLRDRVLALRGRGLLPATIADD